MSEKFNIRIYNQQRVNGSLTALFTSFLYNSQWAITNIKLLQGCSQLTRYDATRESCSICDSDAYLYR